MRESECVCVCVCVCAGGTDTGGTGEALFGKGKRCVVEDDETGGSDEVDEVGGRVKPVCSFSGVVAVCSA